MESLDVKQVIVIRRDLKMRRGKEIAQGSHASIAWLTRPLKMGQTLSLSLFSAAERIWITTGFRKITVRVNSEEELIRIYDQALAANLEVQLIVDSGTTEFGGVPTPTCLAIGPDFDDKIDPITGSLELY